jgi:hypothetical protein
MIGGRQDQSMRILARPGIGETLVSIACVVGVLAVLVAVDVRVRDHFSLLFTEVTSEGVATWGDRLVALGGAVVDAARDKSVDEAPLLIFAGVGIVLLLFMLRT